MIAIRLLGAVEICHGEEVLRLDRRQQRIILGALALDANRLVSREHLIDLLWAGRPPQQARAVLQTRISELKAVLNGFLSGAPGPRISSRNGGYHLAAWPDSIDAHRFLSLLDASRHAADTAQSRAMLAEAVGLWRGPVLGGGLTGETHDRLCRGLESARLTTVEALYTIDMRLGRHGEIVDELVGLAAEHPTREGLVKLALVALHRCGRTGEALREYDRWRRWLRDELGVDPGREVQEVHLALLRSDAAVQAHAEPGTGLLEIEPGEPPPGTTGVPGEASGGAPPIVPHTLAPDTGDFTGRAREIETMREVLTGARTGGGIVALIGPGGVGKTALATHLAHLLSTHFPDGQLMVNLRGFDQHEPASPADVLSRLLRLFGLDPAGIPNAMEDRVDLYRTLTAARRILVVLDNALDDDQVRPLIPAGRGCGAVITSRARLGGTLGARIVELESLPARDAVELLATIAGEARTAREPAAAEELCARCGYLPLAIRVAAARLQAKPHWTIGSMVMLLSDERRRLDHLTHGQLDLRASISMSYRGLTGEAQRLLRAVGDMGVPDVTAWVAAALLDTTVAEACALLEQLFDVQLLDFAGRDDTGLARYRIHDFVRIYAMERAVRDDPPDGLAAGRRRVYGAWLTVADRAHAALVGGDYRNVRGDAPRWPVEDGVLDTLIVEPTHWFEMERQAIATMVRRAAEDDASPPCWELACTISPLFEVCRYYDEWSTILDHGLAVARRTGDLLGEAAMLYRRGCLLADRTDNRSAWRCFQDAARLFEQVGDAHGWATATLFTATVDRFLGDHDAALARYEQALPALHASGDLGGEAQTLRGIGQIHLDRGAYDVADAYFERSVELYRRAGWPLGQAQGLFWHGMLRIHQGRFHDAESLFTQAQAICRSLGDRSGEAQTMRGLALCYRARGAVDRAGATLGDALRLVQQPKPTLLETHIRRAIAELAPAGGGVAALDGPPVEQSA